LVNFTSSNLKSFAHSSGLALNFTDSTNSTKYPYELEQYTSGTGWLTAWVKIPTISSSSDTVLMLHFGNNTNMVGEDNSDITNVWRTEYKAVYHLNDDFLDSTINNVILTNSNTVDGLGQIADGQIFDGDDNDHLNGSDQVADIFDGGGTISMWMNATSYNTTPSEAYMLAFDDSADSQRIDFLIVESNTSQRFYHDFSGDNGQWEVDYDDVGLNNMNYAVLTYNSDSVSNDPIFYRNGTALTIENELSTPTGTRSTTSDGDFIIGNNGNDFLDSGFVGQLDEFRFYNGILSADWIDFEYCNQVGNSTCASIFLLGQGEPSSTSTRSESDTPSITDSATRTPTITRSIGDTPSITDSATRTPTITRSESDTPTITDSATRTQTFSRSESDTPTITDSATRTQTFSRSESDTPTITDSATRTQTFSRSESDTPTITDSATRTPTFTRSIGDTPSITDSATAGQIRSESDTPSITDSSTTIGTFTRSIGDTPSITDSATAGQIRHESDTPSITDSSTTIGTFTRSIGDTPSITDSSTRTQSFTRSESDTPTITDSATAGQIRHESDTPSITDSSTVIGTFTRSVSDTPSITDSASRVHNVAGTRSASDTPTITDSYNAVKTTAPSTGGGGTPPVITQPDLDFEQFDLVITATPVSFELGEIGKGEIHYVWNSNRTLQINSIFTDELLTDGIAITYQTTPLLLLGTDDSGNSIGIVEYYIIIPENYCNDRIQIDCITKEIYNIPVNTELIYDNRIMKQGTIIPLEIKQDETDYFILFSIGVIALFILVLAKKTAKQSRHKRARKKVIPKTPTRKHAKKR